MKLSFRDQMIAAIAAVLIVAVVFVVLVIVPQFATLGELDKDMAKAVSDIASAQRLLAKRQEAKAAAAETQAQSVRVDNMMPDAPELPALIIELQNAANDAGVQIDKLVPTKPTAPADGFQKIQVTFAVSGDWEDVLDFMRRMNELQRSIRVLDVDLGGRPAAGGGAASAPAPDPSVVQAAVSIEAYMMSGAASGPSAPAAPKPTSGG